VDDRERPGIVDVGERLADRDLGDPGDGDDLTGADLIGGDPVELLGDVQLGDLGPFGGPVGAAPRHGVALVQLAVHHAAQGDAAEVRRGVEVRHECLEWCVRVVGRRGDALDQQIEQRLERRAVGQPRAVGRPFERRLALA
jgi:hypothetical protein